MRPVISSVQGALLRAIRRFLEDERQQSFPAMVVEATAREGWASATFSGHRHRLELSFTGGDAARVAALVRELATSELVMPGHHVADITPIDLYYWMSSVFGKSFFFHLCFGGRIYIQKNIIIYY